jgi:hypothetical protein
MQTLDSTAESLYMYHIELVVTQFSYLLLIKNVPKLQRA